MAPSTEAAYVKLRPLLFGALSKLARQGFAIAPQDALDLIHDFFLEVWSGLAENFDPAKGSLEAYSYRAFVHFARPRIIRLQRLRSFLVEPQQLDILPSDPSGADQIANEHDYERVREAIARLPPLHRDVLAKYLYSGSSSQRALANEFSLSRYRVREILIEALGRVTALLDRPEHMPEKDWEVARCHWRNGMTLDQTAAFLGLTPEQVRRANARNIRLIAEALKTH